MKVRQITYKRIQNIGNYSAEHVEYVAEITEEEDIVKCTKVLQQKAKEALNLLETQNDAPWQ